MHHELAGIEVYSVCEALSGVRGGGAARRGAAVGEHAVALRYHHESRHFEASAEIFVLAHERAAFPGGVDVGLQPRAGGFEELRIAGGLHAELCESWKGGCLEVGGRNALRGRIAGEENAREGGASLGRRHEG